ncbi:MLP-like protein 423 [Impatiens glandulifera]|uniref:MLP-like protein 423 n=1 Tax=Impatiens glandulifera TaxID=253017 RepID=UPI001FB188F8|nr:MLP-like protein 423 [Impatiens glandulifera]
MHMQLSSAHHPNFTLVHSDMTFTGKLEVDVEVKSDAEKFWESVKDSAVIFPKAFPDQYKSIEVLEGDGMSVGSVRLVKFVESEIPITFNKEKIDVVDEEKKTLSYTIVDGDILKFYKNFKATLVVSPNSGGSFVKWTCEFDKASEEVPEPTFIKDFAVKNFIDLDAYLKA